MDEYLCLTVLSRPGEGEAAFKGRLSGFWTRMLREKPDAFEKVYAETVAFEPHADRLARKYLVEVDGAPSVKEALKAAVVDFEPTDPDDLFSKYEAAPPDWFWIEH